MTIRLKTILSLFCVFALSAFFTFSSFSQEDRAVLVDLVSRDTIYSWNITETTTKLEFNCGDRKWKYDAAVMMRIKPSSSFSIVVPLSANSKNTFLLEKSGLVPLYVPDHDSALYIKFSNNPYFEEYSKLFEIGTSPVKTEDQLRLVKDFVSQLDAFNRKFKNNQIVGYHLHSIRSGFSDEVLDSLDSKTKKKMTSMIKNGKGFFFDALKIGAGISQKYTCVPHDGTMLKYESNYSIIDPSLIEGNVQVLIFWATWCGPCKPKMKELSDMNKEFYSDSPVYFEAVSSEMDVKKPMEFMNSHEEYNGISWFHDSHQCMAKAYKIEYLPTILIFDKTGKLVARDPEMSEVKSIIDKLILE